MTVEEILKNWGLPAKPRDRAALLALLDEEIEKESREEGDADIFRVLLAQLMSIGQVADCLVIWRVKNLSFDLRIGMDVQFMCGAGLDATFAFLENSQDAVAADALAYLKECIAADDFEDFTPEKWVDYMQRYFGVA